MHAHISFIWRIFCTQSCYIGKFLHLCIWCTVWSMEDGQRTVCCHLWLLRAWDLPSCIYKIPEIYNTKKLQKLQAVKRQVVLQGTDLRWNRPWSMCCKGKWSRQSYLKCHLTAGGHRRRDATVGKVKDRYYWPNFYKEVEEKVHITSSNHFYLEHSYVDRL